MLGLHIRQVALDHVVLRLLNHSFQVCLDEFSLEELVRVVYYLVLEELEPAVSLIVSYPSHEFFIDALLQFLHLPFECEGLSEIAIGLLVLLRALLQQSHRLLAGKLGVPRRSLDVRHLAL